MTLEFVSFLMTRFTFPTPSWKTWHIWPNRGGFFFVLFCIFLCNMLVFLLQLIATALTGWLSQRAWASVFPFSLCEQQAADAGSHQPHELMCFGFVHESQHTGGKKILSNILYRSVGKRFAWSAYVWKNVFSYVNSCVRDPQMHVRRKIINKRAGKMASTFRCALISSRNCMDTYPTFLAVMWCAGLCLSQGNVVSKHNPASRLNKGWVIKTSHYTKNQQNLSTRWNKPPLTAVY